MKEGETIHGYRVTTPPNSAGAGRCRWAFAEKAGREYHLKEFLSPKYPADSSPASAKLKARKRADCAAFEARHRKIMAKTREIAPGGGNLVVASDFFRDGSLYYKVTERIEGIPLPDPRRLDDKRRDVLLKTLAHSVDILHRQSIVHGDLKPGNVIVRQTRTGLYSAKLIDFDDSYFVGEPPPSIEIVGDPSHYSPELLQYIKAGPDAQPDTLGTASDVFALGLVFHTLMAGHAPGEREHPGVYPCEILRLEDQLPIDPGLTDGHADLIRDMLRADARDRPPSGEVIARLGLSGTGSPARRTVPGRPLPTPETGDGAAVPRSGVRANGFGPIAPRVPPASPPPATPPSAPSVPDPDPAPSGLRVGRGFKRP